MAEAWVGTSGYDYDHWNEVFYPEDLAKKDRLAYYGERLEALEINNTFYRVPKASAVKKWVEEAERWREDGGEGFRFFLKGSNYITHTKHLKEPHRGPLRKVFQPAKKMGDELAGFLWQLPGGWRADPEDVDRLRSWIDDLVDVSEPQWRHAIEMRDESWFQDDVFDICKDANVAVVHADMPYQVLAPGEGKRQIPRPAVHAPVTADFVYLRKHGPQGDFGGDYTDGQLATEARHVKRWLSEGKDAYVFFNNDPEGYAIKDAQKLAGKVGATPRAVR